MGKLGHVLEMSVVTNGVFLERKIPWTTLCKYLTVHSNEFLFKPMQVCPLQKAIQYIKPKRSFLRYLLGPSFTLSSGMLYEGQIKAMRNGLRVTSLYVVQSYGWFVPSV